MKAVILAGGQGKRLLPYTLTKPKCLLSVQGRTILDYQLAALESCRIKEVAVVTGFCHETVIDHLAKKGLPIKIIHNANYQETNNAYGLWLARDYLADSLDGFVVINADLIFSSAMLEFLISHVDPDGMIIKKNPDPSSDMVKIAMSGSKIIAMSKDIPLGQATAEAIGPVKFSQLGGKAFMDFIGSFISRGELNHWLFYMLGDFGRQYQFSGIENPGFIWAEIDTPEDLKLASDLIPADFIKQFRGQE